MKYEVQFNISSSSEILTNCSTVTQLLQRATVAAGTAADLLCKLLYL